MASKDERRGRDSQRQAAVNVVAAYLADQDADVYNIADAAVREDALAAALHLTALAARAVRALAEATGRSPDEVLESLSRS
jgi:ParB-like chromosome segregation protein Spo0J